MHFFQNIKCLSCFSQILSLLTVGSWVKSKLHLNVYLAELSGGNLAKWRHGRVKRKKYLFFDQ